MDLEQTDQANESASSFLAFSCAAAYLTFAAAGLGLSFQDLASFHAASFDFPASFPVDSGSSSADFHQAPSDSSLAQRSLDPGLPSLNLGLDSSSDSFAVVDSLDSGPLADSSLAGSCFAAYFLAAAVDSSPFVAGFVTASCLAFAVAAAAEVVDSSFVAEHFEYLGSQDFEERRLGLEFQIVALVELRLADFLHRDFYFYCL